MEAVIATRKLTKSAAISIIITSICIILLIPKIFKEGQYIKEKYNCDYYDDRILFIKKLSLIPLFLIVLYRIYFHSNWYIYAEYIDDDTCMKTMMIEVMVSQRGYRMVYYGIITLISSMIFLSSSYYIYIYKYNDFKQCFLGNINVTIELLNKERNSIIIFGIIIFDYLIESLYLNNLILNTFKNWFYIDYGMSQRSICNQIFFFKITKCNYIIIISYSIIFAGIFFYYKFLYKNYF